MNRYASGQLSSAEACSLITEITRGPNYIHTLRKPARSQIFAYHLHQLSCAFRGTTGDSEHCRAAEQVFHALVRNTRFLDVLEHREWNAVAFVLRLCRFHRHWIRPPETWKPMPHTAAPEFVGDSTLKEKDPEASEQLRSLVRHLFVRYPMRSFWDAVWFQESEIDYQQLDWFVHIATGKNFRNAKPLPCALSKRAVHHMEVSPPTCSLFEAIRWGQIRALGATREFCRSFLQSEAATDFQNDPLWLRLCHLMIHAPDFRPQTTAAIVDYIIRRRSTEPGGAFYTLRPSTLRLLIREMVTFYREHPELVRPAEPHQPRHIPGSRKSRVYKWEPLHGVIDFERSTRDCAGLTVVWKIFELRKSYNLETEGRRLRHCVDTYLHRCLTGVSSIWSLRSFRGDQQTWEATIEIDPRSRTVVQASSYNNCYPTEEHRKWIKKWVHQNGLRLRPGIL